VSPAPVGSKNPARGKTGFFFFFFSEKKKKKKAQKKKKTKIFFDRGIYKYHGRVKIFAETLRKNGMEF